MVCLEKVGLLIGEFLSENAFRHPCIRNAFSAKATGFLSDVPKNTLVIPPKVIRASPENHPEALQKNHKYP